MKAGDFFLLLGNEVLLFEDMLLRLPHVVGILGGVAVDGGHESVGGGADRGTEVIILEKKVFCLFSGEGSIVGDEVTPGVVEDPGGCPRGYWGVLLDCLIEGGGEYEGGGFH